MKKTLALTATIVALTFTAPTVVAANEAGDSDTTVYTVRDDSRPVVDGKVVPHLNPVVIAECNLGVEDTKIGSVETKKDGKRTLKCGNKGWGYIHIRTRHEKDWKTVNKDTIMNWPFWDDLMWDATQEVLEDPDFHLEKKNNKRCYTKKFKILYTGKEEGDDAYEVEFYPSVIVATDSDRIITSIPTKEHLCQP
ncbi:hypothetical protein [Brevibacterium atlanticum]|uniref:hypothetical protein n=1 Tax=Brevibacterium atlanticum TaxID=2697563 RepID=UPI0014219F27|nr:hypothetical protein [Brevibacterium atlanticum]